MVDKMVFCKDCRFQRFGTCRKHTPKVTIYFLEGMNEPIVKGYWPNVQDDVDGCFEGEQVSDY
jgi:hypothetical protein